VRHAPFLDFPTLGVDKNAVLIGGNAFFFNDFGSTDSVNFIGYAIDKQILLRSGLLFLYPLKLGTVTSRSAGGIFIPHGVHNDDPGATKSFFAGITANRDGIVLGGLTFNSTRTPIVLTAL